MDVDSILMDISNHEDQVQYELLWGPEEEEEDDNESIS